MVALQIKCFINIFAIFQFVSSRLGLWLLFFAFGFDLSHEEVKILLLTKNNKMFFRLYNFRIYI